MSGGQLSDELQTLIRDLAAAGEEPDYRDLLLRDGAIIHASLHTIEETRVYGGAKWLALFRVEEVEDPSAIIRPGSLVLRSWNPPRGRHLGLGHDLYRDWRAIVGRPLRSLPARYSARGLVSAFLHGVVARAETCVVSGYTDPKSRQRVTRPEADHYSRISRLVGVVAGTPPYLAHRQRRKP